MADHMGAAIWIGGDIKRRTARKLCDEICGEGVSLDWGEALFEPGKPEDLVAACRQESEGPLLFLCNSEARWGEFEGLEKFLVKHEVSFLRQTDGHLGYSPELVAYHRETGQVHYLTDSGGEPLVALTVARAAEQALKGLLAEKTRSFSRRVVGRIWRALNRQLPPDAPQLTPFRIV